MSDQKQLSIRKCKNLKQNKYLVLYERIILNRLENPLIDCYVERHHILPKSMGGSNDKENIVHLSAREHFICHFLLPKFLYGTDYYKMVYGFKMMANKSKTNRKRYFNSRLFEYYKKRFSEASSTTSKNKVAIYSPSEDLEKQINIGEKIPEGFYEGRRPTSLETKSKLSDNSKGRIWIHSEDGMNKLLAPDEPMPDGFKLGRKNSYSSKEVEINGIKYNCGSDAAKALGVSTSVITHWAKVNGSRYGIIKDLNKWLIKSKYAN